MADSIKQINDNRANNRGQMLLSSPYSQDIQALIDRLKVSPSMPVPLAANWYVELKNTFTILSVPMPYIRQLSLQYLEAQLRSDDSIIEKKLRLGQHKFLSNRFMALINVPPNRLALDWNLGFNSITPYWLELETYWKDFDNSLPNTKGLLQDCWRDTLHSVAMYIEMLSNPRTNYLCPQITPLIDWLLEGHFVYDTVDRLYVLEP